MIYNFVSVWEVISKVMADLDIKEEAQRVADYTEWAGEAIEKIGALKQLERNISGVNGDPYIKISNYQAKLPKNLFRLNTVAYSTNEDGQYRKINMSTSQFDAWSENSDSSDKLIGILDVTYSMKPGYINTTARDGYLKLSYDSIKTDQFGYVLIPDNISYIEAIYWYIVMKITYPEWRSGKVRDAVYYEARRSWNFYCKQAYAEAMMPSSEEMDGPVKSAYLRLIPEVNSGRTFYTGLGVQENIYNKNRRYYI